MNFDKKFWYHAFLYSVGNIFSVCVLCYTILLFWVATGDGAFYAIYEPLPFLWSHPVISALIEFLVYVVYMVVVFAFVGMVKDFIDSWRFADGRR